MTAMSVSLRTAFITLSIAIVASFNAADVSAFIVLLPFRVLGVKFSVSLYCTTKVLLFSHICKLSGYYFAKFLDFLITFNYVVLGSLGLRFGGFAPGLPHMPRSASRASSWCAAGGDGAFSAFFFLIIVNFVFLSSSLYFNTFVNLCLSPFVKNPFTFCTSLTFPVFFLSAALLQVARIFINFAAETQRERLFPAKLTASLFGSYPALPQFTNMRLGTGTYKY